MMDTYTDEELKDTLIGTHGIKENNYGHKR